MPAPAISQRPIFAGSPPAGANRTGQAGGPQGKSFSSTLENYFNQPAAGPKNISTEQNSSPLQALTQLVQQSLAGSQLKLGGQQRLEDIRSETEQLKQQFHTSFNKMLADQGLDLGAGVSLQLDARGEIRVANDHPDKVFIESAIKNNPALENQFKKIAANSSLLHAAGQSQEFQKAYTIDPQKALREYEKLFGKQSPPTFSLTITSGGLKESFSELQATADAAIL